MCPGCNNLLTERTARKHAKEGCPTGRRMRPELTWVVTESEGESEASQSESEMEGTDQSDPSNFFEETEHA